MGGRYENRFSGSSEYHNGRYPPYGRFPPNDGRFGRDYHRKGPPQRWQAARQHNNSTDRRRTGEVGQQQQSQQPLQQSQAVQSPQTASLLFVGEKGQDNCRTQEKSEIEAKLRSFPVAVDLMESVTDAMTALLVTLASSGPVDGNAVKELLTVELPSRLMHLQVRVAARGLSIPYRLEEAERLYKMANSENTDVDRTLKKDIKEVQKQVSEARSKRGSDLEAERLAGQCLDMRSKEYYEESQARNEEALKSIEQSFDRAVQRTKEMTQILNGALKQLESLLVKPSS